MPGNGQTKLSHLRAADLNQPDLQCEPEPINRPDNTDTGRHDCADATVETSSDVSQAIRTTTLSLGRPVEIANSHPAEFPSEYSNPTTSDAAKHDHPSTAQEEHSATASNAPHGTQAVREDSQPSLKAFPAVQPASNTIAATQHQQGNSEAKPLALQPSVGENTSNHASIGQAQQESTRSIATAHEFVNTARILESAAQAEMQIGLHTHTDGTVELRTSVTDHQVSITISSDRNDLHTVLAAELPSLQRGLAEHSLNLASISFHSGLPAGTGQHSGSQQQSPAHSPRAAIDGVVMPTPKESDEISPETLLNVHA
jgi:hypothetical protein